MRQLSPDDLQFMRTFQPTLELSLGDGATLRAYHGSPHSFNDVIRATTPDEELARLLEGFHATVMAGGHTHAQMLRRLGEMIVVNPGSVGLPYEERAGGAVNPAWAEYALVESEASQLRVEFRRVPVDLALVRRAAHESGMPHADWWAGEWQ